ncbi:MAG: hypothetical protein DRG78_15180 [Epsilonproteobacteria bacterium]|nr:MAG: hypothetical protein DRG78_15180 [Campylobacterota bacterium]
MKITNKITIAVLGLGAVLAINGCSAVEVTTGYNFSSADHNLNDASKAVSKVTEAEFKEGSSYVVYIAEAIDNHYDHPSALYKVVDGKVVLAGLIKERPGRMVMEVEPGVHTYLQRSSCGVYTITIDVKKGYGYYINKNKKGLRKDGLMAYCRGQGYFDFQGYMDEANVYKNYKNYSLVSENTAYANKIVANAGLQSEYKSFMEDIGDVRETRRGLIQRQVGADFGFEVGSRL